MSRVTMKMPSPMKQGHDFARVPQASIERSTFDRSHGYKTTFNAGYLIPFFLDEVLPGDTFNLSVTALARLNTPIRPIMDNMFLDMFFFFVPTRLLWSNWQKFNGEQANPGDSVSYTIPQMTVPAGGYPIGSVQDYFGIPTGVPCTAASWSHSTLPFRAYYRIWNDWFRDENLQSSVPLGATVSDGPDSGAIQSVLQRGKRHDYFTSCLPWPQKGTAVSIPLGTSAPVYVGATLTAIGVGIAGATNVPKLLNNAGASNIQATATTGGTQLLADLANATAATINSLRQAFQIQKMLERDARGGTRYTEIIKAHFGVTSPDARLQRTEYLGGGSAPVNIAPVAQTTVPVTDTNKNSLGYMGAAGAAVGGSGFTKSFTEHGYVIGLVSVRADLTYSQGIERTWLRQTRYDFYWPALAHLGEQAVTNAEIWMADNAAQNVAVFGYQERYAEYRYKPSRITGLFRPDAAGTLASWHLSEDFATLPALNAAFIADPTSTVLDRVVQVTTEPDFYLDAWFKLVCARAMPVFGVPGMIDHF